MEQQPNASTPAAIPFGRYRLLELLGQGGMAAVFRAEMQGMGGFSKMVALKIVHAHLGYDPEFIRSFHSEARLGGYISHPNVVETLDFGEYEGRLFLAMEWVNGPTLHQVLVAHRRQNRFIPPDIALQMMIQVCQGLDHAHRAVDHQGQPLRLVHRDLKPSNLLLNRHGMIQIADFGVARAESNVNRTEHHGVIKGTVRYMSPEQAWGSRSLDHRSDLFTVGSLLYECMTLMPLYDGEETGVLLRRAQDAEVGPQLQRIPVGPLRRPLLELLTRALSREPEKRFQSGLELGDAMEAVLRLVPERTSLRSWLAGLGVLPAATGSSPAAGAASSTATGSSLAGAASSAASHISPTPTQVAPSTSSLSSLPEQPLFGASPARSGIRLPTDPVGPGPLGSRQPPMFSIEREEDLQAAPTVHGLRLPGSSRPDSPAAHPVTASSRAGGEVPTSDPSIRPEWPAPGTNARVTTTEPFGEDLSSSFADPGHRTVLIRTAPTITPAEEPSRDAAPSSVTIRRKLEPAPRPWLLWGGLALALLVITVGVAWWLTRPAPPVSSPGSGRVSDAPGSDITEEALPAAGGETSAP